LTLEYIAQNSPLSNVQTVEVVIPANTLVSGTALFAYTADGKFTEWGWGGARKRTWNMLESQVDGQNTVDVDTNGAVAIQLTTEDIADAVWSFDSLGDLIKYIVTRIKAWRM
jgi:hypothetical protein